MEQIEIYFEDLNEEAKKKLLDFFGIKSPKEANLDVFPLVTLPKPED